MERALIGTIVFFLLREFFAELGPLVFDTSWRRSKPSRAVSPSKGDVARGSDKLAQDLRLMPLPESLGVALTAPV